VTDPLAGLVWRRLARGESDLLWRIDRREVVERVYEARDGRLLLRDAFFDMPGWPPGEREHSMPWLEASFDRGAVFLGVFDGPDIAGAMVLDTVPLGPRRDLLQLSFLHVGRDHRGRGLGTALFERAARMARDIGAQGLYVSATPSERTVGFYLARGCRPIAEPDPVLFEREPEDIHFECPFTEAPPRGSVGRSGPVREP
jgi:predicted N-acetyltransferase YhbS